MSWSKIFAVHGGIPETLKNLNQINEVEDEMDVKPFPNEHSCRLRNPDSMKQNSFKSSNRKK